MPLSPTAAAHHGFGALGHLVAFLLAPPALHGLGTVGSLGWGWDRMNKLEQEEMTNLVSFLSAFEAFLRLWTLVNPVAFLPAPPALLRLRAVRCEVALLGTRGFRKKY